MGSTLETSSFTSNQSPSSAWHERTRLLSTSVFSKSRARARLGLSVKKASPPLAWHHSKSQFRTRVTASHQLLPASKKSASSNTPSFSLLEASKPEVYNEKAEASDGVTSGASTGQARADPSSLAAALDPTVVVPRSIHDISNGDHILGFGAQLAEDHPGFLDEEYKRRRSALADLAKTHIIGQPIPQVQYTEAEVEVWRQVLTMLAPLYPTHACSHFLRSFHHFGFSPDHIPQLQDLSEILKDKTGWQIRPVAGLLHPRDFLNGLAFRFFHSTQYIRHGSQPMYTPEPDICHELLGHVPMLAEPEFAELAQAIGEASLGASEKEIWHLTKLYWYTVEFGTILEDNEVKAFGAGILSSYGELAYMRDGATDKDGSFRKPTFLELDPFSKLPKMSYKDGFQRTYFLCTSFHDMADKIRAYSLSLKEQRLLEASQLA